ncbi:IMPACT family protein [Leucobacter allii]|uniref:IMPACT family protein n=1 Tax=Leucobacter allii TaxID=2932247 RepID=A0ABY4FM35_9MICO|nr:YigZ family protein [Leucobacter allii]UOQ57306.1 IMPACT family protein [Leucobacter allii]
MEYETIASPAEAELEISRSRFLARLVRVDDEDGAREAIAQARSAHPRARHHCSAFVLGPGGRVQRSNDDGEPSGTAGAPMLDALVSAGLSDVVAVVTRYFGGVLLGAGGLTRAYRAAVAEAVLGAERVRRGLRVRCAVHTGYEAAAQIEAEARRRGYGVGDAEYSDRVVQHFSVPEGEMAGLAELAAELSSGAARLVAGETGYVDLPREPSAG